MSLALTNPKDFLLYQLVGVEVETLLRHTLYNVRSQPFVKASHALLLPGAEGDVPNA